MASPLINKRQRILVVILSLCLVFSSVLTISFTDDAVAPSPPQFDFDNNMIITGGRTVLIENRENGYSHSGNIIVNQSSTFIIKNSKFIMSPDTTHKFSVSVTENSKFILENSTFTVNTGVIGASYAIQFDIYQGTLEIRNSSMILPGIFNCTQSEFKAINSNFEKPAGLTGYGSPIQIFNDTNVYYEDCSVKDFITSLPIKLLEDSTLIAINTFFDLNYETKRFLIANNSHADLYGVSINTGVSYNSPPIDVEHEPCWANVYRWLEVLTVDKMKIPLAKTKITIKNQTDGLVQPPPDYILNYLGKTTMNYNYTNNSGLVLFPLKSDNITFNSMPNAISTGNYQFYAVWGQYKANSNFGLPSYPLLTQAANNPNATITFNNMISPKGNKYFSNTASDIVITDATGKIKNSIFQKPQGGVVDLSFGQQGNIIINGSGVGGQLDMTGTKLGIEQDAKNKYYILVEENGRLNFASESGIIDGPVAPGTYPINIYMHDSAKMTLSGSSTLNNIGSIGMDGDSELNLDDSIINGQRLYVDGAGAGNSLVISAKEKSKINISDITIKNAEVIFDDIDVYTNSKPIFESIVMTVKNSSFNQKLVFRKDSSAKFYNVTDPWFYNITAMGNSIVEVFWYLTVIVKDQQGNRLEDATVRIFNYSIENGNLVQKLYKSGKTDERGEYTYPVKGGFINSAGHYFGGLVGNYYVNASYFGTSSDSGTRGTRSRQPSGGFDVFGQNQDVEIVIPGTPDLRVVSVVQTPTPTEKNKDATIHVLVQNIGNFTAFNVEVEVWDNDLAKLLKEAAIPVLGPGNSSMIIVKYKYQSEGEYEVQALVDPNELIEELNENNNDAVGIINIISTDRPDLIIVEDSLVTNPISPISQNSEVDVKATIKNVGTYDANNFFVRFYIYNLDDDKLDYGQLGELIPVISLKPNGTFEAYATIDWLVSDIGNFSIEVVVDYGNLVQEINDTNNNAILDIKTVIGPDLTISDLYFTPTPPITREVPFEITAEIANIGPSGTLNFFVGFYLNKLDSELGQPILITDELIPGNKTEIKLIVNEEMAKDKFKQPGEYRIYVYVDPGNIISEIIEDNNEAWKTLIIKKKADLAITANDITFSKLQAENGVNITINAKITNIGETASKGYSVRYFDRNVQIGNKIENQGLEPNKIKTLSITWNSTIGGNHRIRVEVISSETDEESKQNNIAINRIYVKTKPDLYVTAKDIITNKDNEQALEDEEIEITITIHNDGNTSAKSFFVDVWDGAPDIPGSIRIKNLWIFSLSGNSNWKSKPINYTFKTPGLHHIYVVCDINNEIDEYNELNNTGHRSIDITATAPDLTISSEDRNIKPIVNRKGQEVETSTLNDGEKYKFEIPISNLGNQIAYGIEVVIYMDNLVTKLANDTLVNLSGELEIDPTEDIRKSIIVEVPKAAKYDPKATGYHDLIILIDPENKIRESNEDPISNNITIEKAFKIIKANLKITKIEITNSNGDYLYVDESETDITPKLNEAISYIAYVDNLGSENASVSVEFWVDEILEKVTSQKPIGSGEMGVTFTHQTLYDGYDLVDIKCIANGDFGETGDLPISSPAVEVRYDPPEPPKKNGEGGFPILWVILAIVIIVVVLIVVFLMFMKKKREKMAECSECGALIPMEASECPKCGAEFSDEIECGECGALMKVTDTTCPVCGAVFAKEGEELDVEGKEGEDGGEEGGLGAAPSVADLKAKVKSTPPKPTTGAGAVKPKAVSGAPTPPGPGPGGPGPKATPVPTPMAAKPAPESFEDEFDEESDAAEEKAECYRCGAIVPLSASMCPECGAEFE